MNEVHKIGRSSRWRAGKVDGVLLPRGLAHADPGEEVLEFGPDFGARTRALSRRRGRLAVLEFEPRHCERPGFSLRSCANRPA